MSGSITLPTVMTSAGLQPQSPDSIRTQLLSTVASIVPGYTANLPSSMIEDISSTDVYAIAQIDSARVDLVNSLTPYAANPYILGQQGYLAGIPQGTATNTSVYVVFTGTPNFPIPIGFTVSDGTHQYTLTDGGIVQTSGSTVPLFALCTVSDVFAVPANTVTTLITSAPSGVTLTVTNPLAGIAGSGDETVSDYRYRIMEAQRVTCQGVPDFLKTKLKAIPGVQANLVSIQSVSGSGWKIICGGGDAAAVAYAIYQSVGDLSRIIGSTMSVTAVTQANPGQVTTLLNHGYTTGQVVTFSGIGGMTELNTGSYTVTVVDEKNFTIGVDTTGYTAFTTGGEVLPNLRNVVVSINNYPDTYNIPFVIPPQQTLNINATWNTTAVGFVSGDIVDQYGQAALIAYANALAPGAPLNELDMQNVFQAAVASVLDASLLTRLVFVVAINGVSVSPIAGTGVIYGDPESYFYATPSTVSVVQG